MGAAGIGRDRIGIHGRRTGRVLVGDGDSGRLEPVAGDEVTHQQPADGGVAHEEGPRRHHFPMHHGGAHERGHPVQVHEADHPLQTRRQRLAVGGGTRPALDRRGPGGAGNGDGVQGDASGHGDGPGHIPMQGRQKRPGTRLRGSRLAAQIGHPGRQASPGPPQSCDGVQRRLARGSLRETAGGDGVAQNGGREDHALHTAGGDRSPHRRLGTRLAPSTSQGLVEAQFGRGLTQDLLGAHDPGVGGDRAQRRGSRIEVTTGVPSNSARRRARTSPGARSQPDTHRRADHGTHCSHHRQSPSSPPKRRKKFSQCRSATVRRLAGRPADPASPALII